ncbi:MFS transporter [Castellaniella hirudinis]|uniref:MFS transporter n=1 Tax=Castellaniella hirudinis TaxID=1144617 RepID=A0ABV8RYL0_9BURK
MSASPIHADTGLGAPAWGAVIAMMLGVFGLVTAEFLPISLLTPMAADLHISESLAGQAISTTAVLAFIASLLVSSVTRALDRRHVLMGLSGLLIVSNLLVAYAPGFLALLLGRMLLGAALGGFWAMSTAIVMRLMPEPLIPRGLSIMVSGVAAATIFAAPVGSYLGSVIGWRQVFLLAAGLGVLALAVQFYTLPSLPPRGHGSLSTLLRVMRRPRVAVGMLAVLLVFSGHFALFTYVRPYLENVTGVAITTVSAMLLGFGVANYAGTYFGGFMLERNVRLTMALPPLAIGAVGIVLGGTAGAPWLVSALIAVWGFAFGTVPVAWSNWVAQTVPDEAESGGGLLVAAIQVAIALGAGGGGLVLSQGGVTGVFGLGGMTLVAAALLIALWMGRQPRTAADCPV